MFVTLAILLHGENALLDVIGSSESAGELESG